MFEAGSFTVNGVELGLAPESAVVLGAGRLNAELRAILLPAETAAWALSPPLLYFRALRLPEVIPLRLRVDDDLLDEYDIGIYLGEHHDVEGELLVTGGQLRFEGVCSIDLSARWRLEVSAPLDTGQVA